MSSGPGRRFRDNIALRITFIYAGISALWILLSDSLVKGISLDRNVTNQISIAKGWLFVLVTALLLHSLIRRNVDRIRRSEATLMDSERRLTDIISFLPDATLVVDMDGRIIAWNKVMEELTGIPAERVLGKGEYEYAVPFYGTRRPVLVDMILHPDLEVAGSYEGLRQEGDTLVVELFLPDFRPGGVYLWAKASPLRDSRGNMVGAVEALRDVTERKRIEEERHGREERERLIKAEAEEAKQLFYQRTIFSVTDGKLNLVDRSDVEAMMNGDAQAFKLRNEHDLSEARTLVASLAEESGMSDERVYGLATALGEAAANAVKHANGGLVKLRALDDRVQACVIDNGPGMDHLMLPKSTLLKRFSTKASMGLGYSMILGFVDSVYLATDRDGTSILMEQRINALGDDLSLDSLPDTW